MAEVGKKYCKHCGELIDEDCVVCPKCGKQVEIFERKVAQSNYAEGVNAGISEHKKKTALILSGAATALVVVGVMLSNNRSIGVSSFGMFMIMVAIPLAIASYVFAGLGTMLNWCKNLAFVGWLVVPFPWDIVSGICTFLMAVLLFLFVPILPVLRACTKAQ